MNETAEMSQLWDLICILVLRDVMLWFAKKVHR